jgi:hypothetical protein
MYAAQKRTENSRSAEVSKQVVGRSAASAATRDQERFAGSAAQIAANESSPRQLSQARTVAGFDSSSRQVAQRLQIANIQGDDAFAGAREPETEYQPSGRLEAQDIPDHPAPMVELRGGHHSTIQFTSGQAVLGIQSEFTPTKNIIRCLKEAHDLPGESKIRVDEISVLVDDLERALGNLDGEHRAAKESESVWRNLVTISIIDPLYGPNKRRRSEQHPGYPLYKQAVELERIAWSRFLKAQEDATKQNADWVQELWRVGKDILPSRLMPVGELFKDKAETLGDGAKFSYHTGAHDDPIPIIWYKDSRDYPKLRYRNGDGFEEAAFPTSFTLGGMTFGVTEENRPKDGWKLQKLAHNEDRSSQKGFNKHLTDFSVEAQKGGEWVTPAIGDRNQFDGDHVKDLGFGGTDTIDNYWPLDSTINRRAFNGYNSCYVINYLDGDVLKSRAIGGLIGKWFEVKSFMGSSDGNTPAIDPAAAGGTRL